MASERAQQIVSVPNMLLVIFEVLRRRVNAEWFRPFRATGSDGYCTQGGRAAGRNRVALPWAGLLCPLSRRKAYPGSALSSCQGLRSLLGEYLQVPSERRLMTNDRVILGTRSTASVLMPQSRSMT